MAFCAISLLVVYSVIVKCQSLLHFQNLGEPARNNSFIYYDRIDDEGGALSCVTNMSIDCCHDTNVSNWRDERGELVQEGADDGTCLYVNISILALSQHLPSPLVGPVSVNRGKSNVLC